MTTLKFRIVSTFGRGLGTITFKKEKKDEENCRLWSYVSVFRPKTTTLELRQNILAF